MMMRCPPVQPTMMKAGTGKAEAQIAPLTLA